MEKLLYIVSLRLQRIAISKSLPPLFLDSLFGLAHMEFMLNSRSNGIDFIVWLNALFSQCFIRSVYALRSYPELLFVQYYIMGQLED